MSKNTVFQVLYLTVDGDQSEDEFKTKAEAYGFANQIKKDGCHVQSVREVDAVSIH